MTATIFIPVLLGLVIAWHLDHRKAAAFGVEIDALQDRLTEAVNVIARRDMLLATEVQLTDQLAARVNELQAKLDKFKRKRGADGRIIGK